MKRTLVFVILLTSVAIVNSQCITDFTWECEQWKQCLHEGADSTGLHIHYYKDGKVKHKGELLNGVPYGKWEFYDEFGRKFAESNYDGEFYFKSPHELYLFQYIILGNYKNGQRIGDWYYFSIDSTLLFKENYDKSLLYMSSDNGVETIYQFENNERIHQLHNQGANFASIGEIGFLQKGNTLLSSSFFSVQGNNFNEKIREYRIGIYNPITILLDSIKYKPFGLNFTYFYGKDLIKFNKVDISPIWGFGFDMTNLNNKDLNIKYKRYSLLLDFSIDSKFNFLFKDSYFDDNGISLGFRLGVSLHAIGLNKIFIKNTYPKNILNWYYPYFQLTLSWYNKRGF